MRKSALTKGAEGLTDRHRRPLLLNQEEKRARHAARASLAHSNAWRLCAGALSIGSKSARRPPRSAFLHKLWTKPTPALARHPSTKHSAETSNTNFPYNFRALSSATVGSLRCSCQSATPVLLLCTMLSSRVGSWYYSPASLAAFVFQMAFAFWASCGF